MINIGPGSPPSMYASPAVSAYTPTNTIRGYTRTSFVDARINISLLCLYIYIYDIYICMYIYMCIHKYTYIYIYITLHKVDLSPYLCSLRRCLAWVGCLCACLCVCCLLVSAVSPSLCLFAVYIFILFACGVWGVCAGGCGARKPCSVSVSTRH